MPKKTSLKLLLLFILILALVAGGYGLFIWFVVNIMKGDAAFGLLFVAVIAGVASFFNPCSFPVLPAYLASYYTKEETDKEGQRPRQVLISGSVAALGVTVFNILLGILIGILGVGFGKSLGLAGGDPSSIVRWIRGILGVLLLYLGYSHITGRGINFNALEQLFIKFRSKKIKTGSAKMFSYGFGYTLLGIGCGGPILAGLSVYALSLGGFAQALLAFLVYSAVMAGLMIVVSALIALSKETILSDLRKSVVSIKRMSGGLMVLVGVFLVLSSIFVTTFTGILFP